MAVWLQVYGKKVLPEKNEEKLTFCNTTLSELDLDLSFLDDEFGGEKFVYDKKRWVINSESNRLNIQLVVCEYPLIEYNSLKVIFFDNTVVFLGPFIHFQYVSALLENQVLRDGYQKVIQTIFRAFEIKEAIYCTERFFLNDEFDLTFSDLEQQMQKYTENQVERFEDMKEDKFFLESLL